MKNKSKYSRHCFLKQKMSNLKTERHNCSLVMLIRNAESSFMTIIKMNSKLPKSCLKIKVGEHLDIV